MAQTRRTAGAGARRRSEGAGATRAARGPERHEPHHDHAAHAQEQGAHAGGDALSGGTAHAGSSTQRGSAAPAAGGRPADFEPLQEMATEMAPQLGAAAVAAIATAVIVPELLPAVLIGAGATLAPRLLPGVSYVFRPVMKTMMRAGYAAFSSVQHLAAEAGEQMQDVIAEVQAEHRTREGHRSHAGGRHGSESGTAAH